MKWQTLIVSLIIVVFLVSPVFPNETARIDISIENPRYWAYQGKSILLLGGSDTYNLFQWTGQKLIVHLDLLRSVGGNYVRNGMSSRVEGNIQPFVLRDDGKYDLERSNEEYWRRFTEFLRLTHERDIIVQIELWDRFDYALDPWLTCPYNPANNVNYTVEESGLRTEYPRHPGNNENPFFRTVPELENNQVVLQYQLAQVERMLSISLEFPHVLYCMDNETSGQPEWGAYWSRFIQGRARQKGVTIHTTEMWDAWDLSDRMHRHTFDRPELYSFIDISQNNMQKGQTHWDNMQMVRQLIADQPRPMNNVKIYGADTYHYGSDRDGVERFWRNVIGGVASARFHRPPSGHGLGATAQAHLKSARMLVDAMNIFACEPSQHLLSDRKPNEAYLTAEPGRQYAIFFPDGGSVKLDLNAYRGKFQGRWLEIDRSRWAGEEDLEGQTTVKVTTPGRGYWAVLIGPAP